MSAARTGQKTGRTQPGQPGADLARRRQKSGKTPAADWSAPAPSSRPRRSSPSTPPPSHPRGRATAPGLPTGRQATTATGTAILPTTGRGLPAGLASLARGRRVEEARCLHRVSHRLLIVTSTLVSKSSGEILTAFGWYGRMRGKGI